MVSLNRPVYITTSYFSRGTAICCIVPELQSGELNLDSAKFGV